MVVVRDDASWRLGGAADVAWIGAGATVGPTITAAIPPGFDAYATLLQPGPEEQLRHDAALLSVLMRYSRDQPWWLGYLDTGADDVVFPDAPRVRLYADWPYVLVEAGPLQAATWRRWDEGSYWSGHLPNLMFPADRGWLVCSLWDDEWSCIGGPASLVEDLLQHPDLAGRVRPVARGEDATPPGHATA